MESVENSKQERMHRKWRRQRQAGELVLEERQESECFHVRELRAAQQEQAREERRESEC